jgi:hypothetical protein
MNKGIDHEMSSSGRVPVTGIPRDICEQELEIELTFRHLIRFGDSASLRSLQVCSEVAVEQEVTVWILIVALVFICVVGSYLFMLKAS